MKKALIITTISGFLPQFEMGNVHLLQQLGYEVHYASNFNCPIYEYDRTLFNRENIITHHIEIAKSPFHIKRNIRAYRQLEALMEKEKFMLIHCHNPMGGVLGRLAAGVVSRQSKVIYTAHGFHFYKKAPLKNWVLFYPIERLLAHVTDYIVTINREDFVRAKGFRLKAGGEVWQIPGVGLDVKKFVPKPDEKGRIKEELGFSQKSFLILSAGELNKNKNHQAVVRALALSEDQELVYGICGRGPGEKKLERLIHKEGLGGRVKLLGYRNDICRVLHGADCFAFPSRREGLGMAAVEAMASGVVMITSDCRGTREYMRDGMTGIVCRKNRPESYAEAIRQLRKMPEKMMELSDSCRRQALHFSKESTEQIMRQVYEKADLWGDECEYADRHTDYGDHGSVQSAQQTGAGNGSVLHRVSDTAGLGIDHMR